MLPAARYSWCAHLRLVQKQARPYAGLAQHKTNKGFISHAQGSRISAEQQQSPFPGPGVLKVSHQARLNLFEERIPETSTRATITRGAFVFLWLFLPPAFLVRIFETTTANSGWELRPPTPLSFAQTPDARPRTATPSRTRRSLLYLELAPKHHCQLGDTL